MSTKKKRRAQGRPASTEAAVGRERIIAATRALLATQVPARVTLSAVARAAGIDPALIRYYFGDRTSLLMAVAASMTDPIANEPPPSDADPAKALAEHLRKLARFSRSANSMQRLMIDELAQSKNVKVRKFVQDLHLRSVEYYRSVLNPKRKSALIDADPLLLHIAVLGMTDFFITAKPIIEMLVGTKSKSAALTQTYDDFVVDLLLNGLKKRR